MARLVGGITGRAAGTCAGVQLYKSRRGSGTVTAVRSAPEITAPRSAAQLTQQLRMSEIRRLLDTILPAVTAPIRPLNKAPFGWFADWFALWEPMISGTAPFAALRTTGQTFSKWGAIPRSEFVLTRVSSTSLTLRWPLTPFLPGQYAGDRLFYALFTCSQPWNRTSTYHRWGYGTTSRSGTFPTLASLAPNQPAAVLCFFANAQTTPTKREPLTLLTISG